MQEKSSYYLSVGLDVAQKIQEGLGGLLGPLHLVTRGLVLLSNGVSANATGVLGERNGLLESKDVLKVSSGLGDRSALNGLTNLTAVLEVHSQVGALSLGSLGNIVGLLTVVQNITDKVIRNEIKINYIIINKTITCTSPFYMNQIICTTTTSNCFYPTDRARCPSTSTVLSSLAYDTY